MREVWEKQIVGVLQWGGDKWQAKAGRKGKISIGPHEVGILDSKGGGYSNSGWACEKQRRHLL